MKNMGVVSIVGKTAASSRGEPGLRQIRQEYGLSVTQAAAALRVPAVTVERWEAIPGVGPGEEFLRYQFEEFNRTHDHTSSTNFLFGVYPLRLARELLCLSIDEISSRHNYSKSAWQKFESNDRLLDRSVLKSIEDEVSRCFIEACNSR